MNPACDFCYACYQHGHVEEYCPKPMKKESQMKTSNLTDKAEKFLETYQAKGIVFRDRQVDRLAAFASECIEAENARLTSELSGYRALEDAADAISFRDGKPTLIRLFGNDWGVRFGQTHQDVTAHGTNLLDAFKSLQAENKS